MLSSGITSIKIEAARVLYRHGSFIESQGILRLLWTSTTSSPEEKFVSLCGLLEIWCSHQPQEVSLFIQRLMQGEELPQYWDNLDISEQSTLYEWRGQIEFVLGNSDAAFECLSRAASLGRDTATTWKILGDLCVENRDLDLAVRYIRRSLQVSRQVDFDLVSGRNFKLGFFSGDHPLTLQYGLEDYLKSLFNITKLAKGQKNLRGVRELVVDMIHQYPQEARLLKIRLLVEQSAVQMSVPGLNPIHLSAPSKLTNI